MAQTLTSAGAAVTSSTIRLSIRSFGALHQMLSSLDLTARDAAWAEVGSALCDFQDANGAFAGPCELVVVAGTK
jgi:hypothetical protein